MFKKIISGIALAAFLAAGVVPAFAEAIDSDTKFLVQGNNTGTPTTFLDTSSNSATVTTAGGAKQIAYKINKYAGFFDGSSQVFVPDHSDWDIGTGDFTVEFYIMPTDVSTEYGWFGLQDSTNGIDFLMSSSTNIRVWLVGSSHNFTVSALTPYTWYHVALVRQSGTVKVYLDGTAAGSASNSGSVSSSTTLKIGSRADSSSKYKGWMKELRVSNTARYTANFTPSTGQFSSDANTKLLLHFDNTAAAPLSPAIKFDGSGDYLTVADHADWDFSDFTVEFWVRFNSASGDQTFICRDADVTKFMIRRDAGNFAVYVAGTEYSGAWTPVADRWYHIAVSRSGSNLYRFIDGVPFGSTQTNGTAVSSTSLLMVGARITGASHYLNGWMKNIRVSNTARYTAQFTPTQTAFADDANTKLLILGSENNGVTTFVDSEGTPKTITTNGNSVISYEEDYRNTIFKDDGSTGHKPYETESSMAKIDFVVPFGNGAGYCDGSGDYVSIPDAAWQDLGTAAWTVDGWIKYMAASPASTAMIDIGGSSSGMLAAVLDTGGVAGFHVYLVGTEYYSSHAYTAKANTWYYFRAVRSSNSLYMFINGTQNGNTEDVTGKNVTGLTSGVRIGSNMLGSQQLNGFFDNVRVSTVSRGTSAFNPPSEELGATGRKRANVFIN